MRVLKSKRGISPLIATILLIAFAVAIGAVVMQFGSGLEAGGCGADLQVTVQNACVGGKASAGKVEVEVKNIGATDIESAELWVYGDKSGIKTASVNQPLARGEFATFTTDYDFMTYGKIKKAEFIPVLEGGLQCEDNSIIIKKFRKC